MPIKVGAFDRYSRTPWMFYFYKSIIMDFIQISNNVRKKKTEGKSRKVNRKENNLKFPL